MTEPKQIALPDPDTLSDAELASVVEKFGRLLSDWSRDLQQVPAEHAR